MGASGGSSISCPEGYIPVPGNPEFNTEDFCVAKYEMKKVNIGGQDVAVSQAAGTPWVSINRNDTRAKCAALGTGYSLITNDQWQTIARNIEQVAENWENGTIGSVLNRGHSDGDPYNALAASTDDNQACSGTNQSCTGTSWNLQKRTHNRKLFGPSNSTWTSAQGIGQIYGGSAGAVLRGGAWANLTFAGVFGTFLYRGLTYSDTGIGFRRSFVP